MGATFSTLCKKCVGSLCPLLTSTEKMQETGPMVYHPYLRRLGFPSICGCHSKDSRFFSVISRPWMLRSRVWTVNLPHTVQHSTTWATQSVVSSGSSFQAQFLMQMFIPIYLKTINNKLKKKKLQLAIWLLIIECKIITTTHFVIKIFCLSAMAIKTVTFWSASHIAENSVNFLPKSPFQDYAITHTWEDNHTTTPSVNHGSKPLTLSGFSMEGGTWWLIAAYFGIYSRLLWDL